MSPPPSNNMRLILLLFISTTVTSLNILITTTDSWVSKNTRLLYSSLKEKHNVKLIAPLYQYNLEKNNIPLFSNKLAKDGGEYGHLLSVHQTYFHNLRSINSKRAKGVKFEQDESQSESESSTQDIVQSNQFGQDPLDKNCWYVDSNPFNSLQIGLDVILPNYYPDFKPDLTIIGPNEGLQNQQIINKMIHSTITNNNISTIAFSTEDEHHIYYQDENYFHISSNSIHQLMKHNVFTKNIKFINKEIGRIIDNLSNKGVIGLDFKFPSFNHFNSHCITSNSLQLKMQEFFSTLNIPNTKFNFKTEREGQTIKIVDVEHTQGEAGPEIVDMFTSKKQQLLKRMTNLDVDKGLINCNLIANVLYGETNF